VLRDKTTKDKKMEGVLREKLQLKVPKGNSK